jgi:hypothetical protein
MTNTRPSVPTSALTSPVVPAAAHAFVVGSSAVRTQVQAFWAPAPSTECAVAPAAVSGLWLAAPGGYEVRIAPISATRQGTTLEVAKINLDEHGVKQSTEKQSTEKQSTEKQSTTKGNTSAQGAGMTMSLRRSGGVPPRGRPV